VLERKSYAICLDHSRKKIKQARMLEERKCEECEMII